jgi:CO/xanthine dehydrogenase Mo-binding subunit
MAFTEDGRAAFRSLRDYRIATAADVLEVRTLFVPLDAPPTPFGARPLGDVAATGPALAIANAVAHAIGARVTALPLAPERVLQAAARKAP